MPRHGRAVVRPGERGFGVVELIVVCIIVAILFAALLPTLSRTREKVGAPQVNLAAGTIWRGIQQFRLENSGALPPVALLTAQHTQTPPGRTFANPADGRYVDTWPDDNSGDPMEVVAGAGAVPMAAVAAGSAMAGKVVYSTSGGAAPVTGWLVGYADNGQIVFRRSISPTIAAAPPVG